jgi:uncharacterized membrane protein (DUF485 family)
VVRPKYRLCRIAKERGITMDTLYREIEQLFSVLTTMAWFCLLVALIVLAGETRRWLRSKVQTDNLQRDRIH